MVRIKTMKPGDCIRAGNLIKRAIARSQCRMYPPELVEEFCKKYSPANLRKRLQEITYFIAEDTESKRIVGIIGIKGNELRTFFVDPSHQGRGIGRHLYERLEEEARKRKLNEIVVEGGPIGKLVYEKFGFKETRTLHKERKGIKYTDVLMKKKL